MLLEMKREYALLMLLDVGPGVEEALNALRCDAQLVNPPLILGLRSLFAAFQRFNDGELSASAIERWAEALHTAEDVEFDHAASAFIAQAMFELSTPELFGPMAEVVSSLEERAEHWG